MKLKEFYREIGSSYADVTARLGNEEFVRYFVLLFKDDKSFEELKESLKKGLAEDAFRAAHTLKGVAANLGFSALYENAAEITEALRGGDLNAAAELFPHSRKNTARLSQPPKGFEIPDIRVFVKKRQACSK